LRESWEGTGASDFGGLYSAPYASPPSSLFCFCIALCRERSDAPRRGLGSGRALTVVSAGFHMKLAFRFAILDFLQGEIHAMTRALFVLTASGYRQCPDSRTRSTWRWGRSNSTNCGDAMQERAGELLLRFMEISEKTAFQNEIFSNISLSADQHTCLAPVVSYLEGKPASSTNWRRSGIPVFAADSIVEHGWRRNWSGPARRWQWFRLRPSTPNSRPGARDGPQQVSRSPEER
jgi:hypothetical protein